jgi:hypothetical protein
MIRWQEMRISCNDETGFAAARFLQRIHEAGERRPLRLPSPDPGENGGGSVDAYCGIHEILLFRNSFWLARFTAS